MCSRNPKQMFPLPMRATLALPEQGVLGSQFVWVLLLQCSCVTTWKPALLVKHKSLRYSEPESSDQQDKAAFTRHVHAHNYSEWTVNPPRTVDFCRVPETQMQGGSPITAAMLPAHHGLSSHPPQAPNPVGHWSGYAPVMLTNRCGHF